MPEFNQELLTALPGAFRRHVRKLDLMDGVATVVIDVGGLAAAAQQSVERKVRDALGILPHVRDVHIELLTGRTAPQSGPRIIVVGSGKGGVGKSTLSANLAIALARIGKKVGMVDADIHGPSQPRLMGSEGAKPATRDGKLVPVAGKWGVPLLSIGHFSPGRSAIAWRGIKAAGAVGQMIDGDWGDTDLLIVDLPPGTGDIQLSLLKRFPPAGAVIVSTPQDLALIDAERAMALFVKSKVPIIGLVENMSGYACPHCGEVSDPFGSGGAEQEARRLGIPFLGKIPLKKEIRLQSDKGTPPAAGEGEDAQAFAAIARQVDYWLNEHSA